MKPCNKPIWILQRGPRWRHCTMQIRNRVGDSQSWGVSFLPIFHESKVLDMSFRTRRAIFSGSNYIYITPISHELSAKPRKVTFIVVTAIYPTLRGLYVCIVTIITTPVCNLPNLFVCVQQPLKNSRAPRHSLKHHAQHTAARWKISVFFSLRNGPGNFEVWKDQTMFSKLK